MDLSHFARRAGQFKTDSDQARPHPLVMQKALKSLPLQTSNGVDAVLLAAASWTTPTCRLLEMAPPDFPRYPTRETGGDNASVKGYVYALLWYVDSLTPE